MRRTRSSLEQVNPSCEYHPPGHDEGAWKAFRGRVQEFSDKLTEEFEEAFIISGESHIQDSTHGAEIYLPSTLIIGEGAVIPCIRISNHDGLFVITVVRRVSNETELRIEGVAEKLGLSYAPESLFGEPFDLRQRANGDLFNQLFDYV